MSTAPIIRPARLEDASHLVEIIDLASEGLLPLIWAQMAPEGADPAEIGIGLVAEESGEFSYRNGSIAEVGGAVAGGMISYPMPDAPAPVEPDVPEIFAGVKALGNMARGRWYINVIATFPGFRRRGVARALLDHAERAAGARGCPGLALIVAASNAEAMNLYEREGYSEVARRPFDVSAFGLDPTDAVLMQKDMPRAYSAAVSAP